MASAHGTRLSQIMLRAFPGVCACLFAFAAVWLWGDGQGGREGYSVLLSGGLLKHLSIDAVFFPKVRLCTIPIHISMTERRKTENWVVFRCD